MHKLFCVAVEGHELVALSTPSGVEMARVTCHGETTQEHITAGEGLIRLAFENLTAQGYDRCKEE